MKRQSLFVIAWASYVVLFLLSFFLRKIEVYSILLFIVGNVLGFVLPIFLDVLVPHLAEGSAKASKDFTRSVITQGVTQVKQGNLYIEDQKVTPLRSYPMLLGYFFTAIFVLTSTENFLGKGFVIGIGLSLVLDLWFSSLSFALLQKRWFSVFQTRLTEKELRWFVYGVCGVFGVLTLLALFV